jgi:hypothetical protein
LDGKQWLRMSFVDPCPYPFDGISALPSRKPLVVEVLSGWALTKDLVKWLKFWAWARVSEVHG